METGLRKGQEEEQAAVRPEESRGIVDTGQQRQVEERFADIRNSFSAGGMDAKRYSPLALAYLGDAVYELLVRTLVVAEGNAPVNKLNRRASSLSKAAAQSDMAKQLTACFTGEELAIYKRGRNAHSYTKAKNATVSDYRRATGLEAVFGFLYLKGQMGRIIELINVGVEALGYQNDHGALR